MPRSSLGTASRALRLIGVLVLLSACDSSGSPLEPEGPDDPEPPAPASLPAFAVTSQDPGEMIVGGTDAPMDVEVAGQVCDPLYPITNLVIDGVNVPVSGTSKCAAFSLMRPSRWGLTMVKGEATNANGQVGHLAHSFLRSGEYLADNTDGGTAAPVSNAAIAHLGATMLDDGDHSDVDDLASIIRAAFLATNINSLIPSVFAGGVPSAPNCPALPNLGYRIAKGGTFTHGAITVSQVVVGDTIKVTARMNAPHLPVTVNGYSNGCITGLVTTTTTGSVGAGWIQVTLPFVPAVVEGAPSWGLVGAKVVYARSALVVNVDMGVLDFLGGIVNTIASGLANLIAGFIEPLFADEVKNQILEQVLAFEGIFELDGDGLIVLPVSALELALQQELEEFRTEDGGLKTGSKIEIKPGAGRPGEPPAKGPVKHPAKPAPTPKPGTEYLLAINWDLLNQYLWSAWQKGAFDLTTFVSPGCGAAPLGLTLASTAELPPVVMPHADGEGMQLGIGGLYLTGTVDPAYVGRNGPQAPLGVTLSAIVDVSFEMDMLALRIKSTLAPGADVGLQIGTIGGAELAGPVRSTFGPYLGCVARDLAKQVLDAFPIPLIKVGKMPVSGLPPEEVWTPKEGSTAVQKGWIVHEGKAP